MSRLNIAILATGLWLGAQLAHGASLTLSAFSDLNGSGPTETVSLKDTDGVIQNNADGTQDWIGNYTGTTFKLNWNLKFDPDPGVSGMVSVSNATGAPQFYQFTTGVVSTVSIPSGSTKMSGASVLSVADSDLSNSPATVGAATSAGSAVYTGLIAGATQRTLFSTPFTLTAPGNGLNSTSTSFANENASSGVNVGDIVGLRHEFLLSGGDSATVLSNFVVTPEPASSLVLVFGIVGFLGYRRGR